MTDPDDDRVDANELGLWLGVTSTAVRDAARRGVLERDGRRFALQASVQRYCAHLRRLVVERAESPAAAERARLTRAQAVLASLKAQRLGGALVAAADVQSEWVHVMSATRARLLAVPSRVQQTAPHLTQGDVEAIDREIREALSALADGDGKSSETDGFSALTDEVKHPPS
jgi:terminase small subunit / prophage DNA-packing protein